MSTVQELWVREVSPAGPTDMHNATHLSVSPSSCDRLVHRFDPVQYPNILYTVAGPTADTVRGALSVQNASLLRCGLVGVARRSERCARDQLVTTVIRVACRLPTIRTAVSCLLRVSEAGATEGDQRAGRRPTRNKFPGGPYRHVREPSCTRTSCQPTDVIPLHRQRRQQRGRASQRFDRVTTVVVIDGPTSATQASRRGYTSSG